MDVAVSVGDFWSRDYLSDQVIGKLDIEYQVLITLESIIQLFVKYLFSPLWENMK